MFNFYLLIAHSLSTDFTVTSFSFGSFALNVVTEGKRLDKTWQSFLFIDFIALWTMCWLAVIVQHCGFCLCPPVWSEPHWSWFLCWESMKWCLWCWQMNAWKAGVFMLRTSSISLSTHFRFAIRRTFLFVLIIFINHSVSCALFRDSWLLCYIVSLMARYASSVISQILFFSKLKLNWNCSL